MHPAVSRARSDYGFEDGQAFMSLPASPPSHPTSYISVASMSPEVAMRKGSGAGIGTSALSRSESDASVNIGSTFDFAIQEEEEPESSTAEFVRKQVEEANATLTAAKPRGMPTTTSSNVHGLGLSMSNPYAQLHALAIPKSHGRSSEALSASPPNSMTSSMHSRAGEATSQSPPMSMGPAPELPQEPKTVPLASPARVRSDPLLNVHVKISDLGNSINYEQLRARGGLPENVCTRNYRPPENVIGADYDLGIDVWALGCVVSREFYIHHSEDAYTNVMVQIYELITGEMMFNPQHERYRYTKEDDLLAQQIEIRK